jgi:hypothetical protein
MTWWDSFKGALTANIERLKEWNRTQRLFYYSVLVTLFLVGMYVYLPRLDCATGRYPAACDAVNRSYQP